ncbi:MAG: methyltransferase domain-containing protein [Thiotrichaceae bacterium]|nr:methyltransferase domain-containing protein [Thiotrichaceae bacterium]
MNIKWWMKIPAKLILSRTPIARSFLRKFSIFRHGDMDNSAYAFDVVNKHYQTAKPWLKKDFTALELGPGDSLLSALIISALGAKKVYLVDVGDIATKELTPYTNALQFLEKKGFTIDFIKPKAKSRDEFFENIDMSYLTNGLESLRNIPDESIDFIWSHAVLEHVRLHEFDDVMAELRRILKPEGVCSHVIDLKDHFEQSLNNLRFSDKTWESRLFSTSGFYTNRIRHNQMIDSFENVGFKVSNEKRYTWDALPVAKTNFTRPYSDYEDKNLLINEFDITLLNT